MLIFADAMVGKLTQMLDHVLALLRPGGFVHRSTTCCRKQAGPRDTRPGSARLMTTLADRAELCVVNLAWSSGLVVAARRG